MNKNNSNQTTETTKTTQSIIKRLVLGILLIAIPITVFLLFISDNISSIQQLFSTPVPLMIIIASAACFTIGALLLIDILPKKYQKAFYIIFIVLGVLLGFIFESFRMLDATFLIFLVGYLVMKHFSYEVGYFFSTLVIIFFAIIIFIIITSICPTTTSFTLLYIVLATLMLVYIAFGDKLVNFFIKFLSLKKYGTREDFLKTVSVSYLIFFIVLTTLKYLMIDQSIEDNLELLDLMENILELSTIAAPIITIKSLQKTKTDNPEKKE